MWNNSNSHERLIPLIKEEPSVQVVTVTTTKRPSSLEPQEHETCDGNRDDDLSKAP